MILRKAGGFKFSLTIFRAVDRLITFRGHLHDLFQLFVDLGKAAYEVLVDNVAAKENVSRFARHQGYQVQVEEQGEEFLLRIKK